MHLFYYRFCALSLAWLAWLLVTLATTATLGALPARRLVAAAFGVAAALLLVDGVLGAVDLAALFLLPLAVADVALPLAAAAEWAVLVADVFRAPVDFAFLRPPSNWVSSVFGRLAFALDAFGLLVFALAVFVLPALDVAERGVLAGAALVATVDFREVVAFFSTALVFLLDELFALLWAVALGVVAFFLVGLGVSWAVESTVLRFEPFVFVVTLFCFAAPEDAAVWDDAAAAVLLAAIFLVATAFADGCLAFAVDAFAVDLSLVDLFCVDLLVVD